MHQLHAGWLTKCARTVQFGVVLFLMCTVCVCVCVYAFTQLLLYSPAVLPSSPPPPLPPIEQHAVLCTNVPNGDASGE